MRVKNYKCGLFIRNYLLAGTLENGTSIPFVISCTTDLFSRNPVTFNEAIVIETGKWKKFPPTTGVLFHHSLRSVYQASIWSTSELYQLNGRVCRPGSESISQVA